MTRIESKKKSTMKPRRIRNGTSKLLRSLKVGQTKTILRERLSAPNNLHSIAGKVGVKISLKSVGDTKIRITRVK